MRIRVVGSALPGACWAEYTGVEVGVQRNAEVLDAVPGDADTAVFDLDVTIVDTADGTDFRGPFVHGRRGARFVYLVWTHTHTDTDGRPVMFRRAKLLLGPVADLIPNSDSDSDSDLSIEGRLALTDRQGGPLCASVTPPAITWQVTA